MECGDGCASIELGYHPGDNGDAVCSNMKQDTSCMSAEFTNKRLSCQIDMQTSQHLQAQCDDPQCNNSSSVGNSGTSTMDNRAISEIGDGTRPPGGVSTQSVGAPVPLYHPQDIVSGKGCNASSATSCTGTGTSSASCNTFPHQAAVDGNQSNVTRTTTLSTDVATAAAAAAHYTLKSLSSTLYHDNEAHVLHQQPPISSNINTGGSANNTVQTPHQVRVASSHQQQQPTQSTILQSHHAFTQQPQNKALMPNGKLQASILKKPPLLPAAGAGTNQCAVSPYMTSSKSADSISNLTATLDRWHTIGGSGVAARRSSHLPSSFSNYSFNYNSVNTSNNNTSQPTSTASPTTPVAGTAGSSHLFNNNFKRNSSSVIPFHRNQPIGNNHNLPDIFCHNNSSVMPSDSYYSFFTPSSNSVSTIPAAYEYHPLCSNPASPCEDKIHFGKMGARPNEIEVVGHTSTGGRPVSCRDLIVLTFIAAILMGMTLAFLVTLFYFLEQIECSQEGNCKNRHLPFF